MVSLIILIGIGVVCAYIHKNKGYSLISGFLWGFCFSIIGLCIILLEKTKEEKLVENTRGLSMLQWLLIFLGIGMIGVFIFLYALTNGLMFNEEHKVSTKYRSYTENISVLEYDVPSKFTKARIQLETNKSYMNTREGMFLGCVCGEYKEEGTIINYINNKYGEYNDMVGEIQEEEINGVKWYKFYRDLGTARNYYYITINNNYIYTINLMVDEEKYYEQCEIYLASISKSLKFN